jgi:hypothetical protein
MWLGMTIDEIQRVKPSQKGWVDNVYPLVDAGLTRAWCEAYLKTCDIRPTKSACSFCPYRSRESWKMLAPADLQAAIEYDRTIRHAREGLLCYVHRDLIALEDAVSATPPLMLPGMMGETIDDECEGVCELN